MTPTRYLLTGALYAGATIILAACAHRDEPTPTPGLLHLEGPSIDSLRDIAAGHRAMTLSERYDTATGLWTLQARVSDTEGHR